MLPAIAAVPVVGPIMKAIPGWVWKVVFLLAVVAGTYIIIRKIIRNLRYNSSMNSYGSETKKGMAVDLANDFHNAFFQLGSWWRWVADGTDEELVYDCASRMHSNNISFGDVAMQYKILFGRDLLTDFNNELSNEERQRFNTILASGLSGIAHATGLLVSNKPTLVLNEKFQPVREIPSGVKLGGHLESFLLADGRKLHGFQYQNQMRYVNSLDTNLIRI